MPMSLKKLSFMIVCIFFKVLTFKHKKILWSDETLLYSLCKLCLHKQDTSSFHLQALSTKISKLKQFFNVCKHKQMLENVASPDKFRDLYHFLSIKFCRFFKQNLFLEWYVCLKRQKATGLVDADIRVLIYKYFNT